jgi:coenzyme F420-reducing hydrogenase gamma subunit
LILKDCQSLVDAYLDWLRQKTNIESVNGVCVITAPFLDRHNDQLQIYVKKTDTGLILTDDGYITTDLRLSGCEFTTEKRRQMLRSILDGFGVRLEGDELIVEATLDSFPQKNTILFKLCLL